jgi:predicted amidohydrolase
MAAPNIYLVEDEKYYDATILIGDNGEILLTQKMVHIAQASCFYEQDYYTPANDGFHVIDTPYGRIGIVICFDRHYQESIRTETIMGADLILIPTANTTDEPMEMFEWEIRVQAFQNSIAIAMCNRVGVEGKMTFSGESLVVSADGNVIKKADSSEKILYADVDLTQSRKIRDGKPYTNLRRKEWYQ